MVVLRENEDDVLFFVFFAVRILGRESLRGRGTKLFLSRGRHERVGTFDRARRGSGEDPLLPLARADVRVPDLDNRREREDFIDERCLRRQRTHAVEYRDGFDRDPSLRVHLRDVSGLTIGRQEGTKTRTCRRR